MLEETAKKAETAATKYDNEMEKISQYKQTMDDPAKANKSTVCIFTISVCVLCT